MAKAPSSTHQQTSAREASKALLEAARRHFAAKGYEASPLRLIAAEAGVDVALVSYHFGGKLGLWKAVVARAALELHAALSSAETDPANATSCARLRQTMAAYIGHLLAHPEVPRLILRDITVDTDRSDWLLHELSAPLHRRFAELALAATQDRPQPPAHLEFQVANFIYSAASSVARRGRLGQLASQMADDSQFASALEKLLIDGALRCG